MAQGLIAQTLKKLSEEDDHRHVQAAEWDPRSVELNTALKTRIPDSVEQRCRQARIRGNCGLFAQTHHAWASADELLHIWDYHKENPKVLVLPADSAIVSVALCPPRLGVFDQQVQWLLVICTRLTVSLVGLHYEPSTGLARPTDRSLNSQKPETTLVTTAGVATSLFHPRPGTDEADGLTLLQLEGYSARCEGALFHLIRHTSDGHILLASGAPQVYELAYSQSAGWFTSKCRLIRHAGGLQAWLRDFLHLSWRCTGRLRLLECASQGYVVAVDDTNSLHLFRIDDWALVPSRPESVAVLQELVALSSPDLAQMAFQLSKRPLASRIITHLFPVLGLDGHLRLQVVTSASEHLLFVCSASSPNGPSAQGSEWSIVQEFDADWTKAQPNADVSHPPGTRFHGFWLQQVTESRLGGTTRLLKASESQGSRHSCLEEIREPCVYASGVWVQCAASPGSVAMEVGITARVEDSLEPGNAKSLQTSILMDAPVLDLVEEADRSTLQARKVRRREGISVTSKLDELEGEPAAFRSSRSFAMMLPNCVQVIRLNFKSVATQRAPLSATECCTQLAQLSQVNGSTPVQARWSFDDVGVPSFEEQRRHLATASSPPPVRLGRWLQGLLRFLAVALRPVWDLPLVVTVSHRETLGLVQQSLGLGIAEDAVRRLIGRLRPAVRFAHGAESGQKSKAVDPASSSAARFKLYTSERSVQSEAVAQARQTLHGVLEVADRALEVLSLLSLLQEQKSAYRVLRSNLLSSDLLQRLQCTSFGQLVESDDALDPAVQLCSAFLVESGLTTPMADAQATPGAKFQRFGSAGGLCRDLEEQCPQIFKKLDLSFVNSRFGDMAPARPLTAAAFGKAAVENQESCLELLHRYAQCVSVNSPEDHWVSLSQTLRAAVSEDPKRAAEVCVEKLQQLQLSAITPESQPGVEGRVMQLLESLLGAVSTRPMAYPEDQGLATQNLVEQLLTRTSSVRYSKENSERLDQASVSFVHKAILEYLLASPHLRPVVEALLGRSGQGHGSVVEAFLQDKAGKHGAAGELLWRHRIRQGRVKEAAEVMLLIASGPGASDLSQRVRLLDQAKQAARRAGSKAQLDVAARVQLPLQRELDLLILDVHVSERWRSRAKEERKKLDESLLKLQDLYQIAVDLGFYHLVLVIVDLTSSTQDMEAGFTAWLRSFLPLQDTPYSPGQLQRSCYATRSHGLFPLLLVRRSQLFLQRSDPPQLMAAAEQAGPKDFKLRAVHFIGELAEALRSGSPLWDARAVGTLLEFCSCLWRKASGAAASDWVALEVLAKKPFQMPLAALLRFYTAVVSQLPSWSADLRTRLDGASIQLSNSELYLHLSQVVLCLVEKAQGSVELRGNCQALLKEVRLQLQELDTKEPLVKRLLTEVQRLSRDVLGLPLLGDGGADLRMAPFECHWRSPKPMVFQEPFCTHVPPNFGRRSLARHSELR